MPSLSWSPLLLLLLLWISSSETEAVVMGKQRHRRRQRGLQPQHPSNLFDTQAHVHTLVHEGKAKKKKKHCGKAGKAKTKKSFAPTASPTMTMEPTVFCTEPPSDGVDDTDDSDDGGEGENTGDGVDNGGGPDEGDGVGSNGDDGTGDDEDGTGDNTGSNEDGTGDNTGSEGDGDGTGSEGDGQGGGSDGDGSDRDGDETGSNGDETTGDGDDGNPSSGSGPDGGQDETLEEKVDRICQTLTEGTFPQGEVARATYNIDLQLLIESGADKAAVLLALQELLQLNAAPNLSMCTGIEENRRRRLQTAGILGAAFFPTEDEDSFLTCDTDVEGDCLNVDIQTIVFHVEGTDSSTFGQFVYDEMVKHCDAMKEIENVIETLEPCDSILLTPTGGTAGGPIGPGDAEPTEEEQVAGAVRASDEDDGLGVGGIAGVAAAGVAIVALFLLLAIRRKRRDEYNLKHHTLVELEGDTYLNETQVDSQSVATRRAHIVGEADSVFSGWTGYSNGARHSGANDDQLYMGRSPYGEDPLDREPATHDVHQCSSATCEVCEQKRRQGLQFIPTMPSHSHDVIMRTDTREYVASDTVSF